MSPAIRVTPARELRAARRSRAHRCWGHLIAAPLWPMHGADLSLNVAVAGSLLLYRLAGLL